LTTSAPCCTACAVQQGADDVLVLDAGFGVALLQGAILS
jgi:hypothetical protein